METTNRMPTGGYLAPLLPDAWFDDAPQVSALLGALDTLYENARLVLEGCRQARTIASATGSDLDELGSWLGLERIPQETDGAFRLRIPATARNGIAASTGPAMQALLEGAFAVPASVDDTATAGGFTITLYAQVPYPAAVMPLVRQYKAAGMRATGQMLISTADGRGVAGTVRAGDAVAGGSAIYVPLS